MTLITLPQSGAIIDLDSVSFVIKTQSKTAGNGIAVGAGGSALKFYLDDARRFLQELKSQKHANVETLLKWISATSKS